MYRLSAIILGLTAAFSFFIVFTAIGELIQGGKTPAEILIGLIAFFGFIGVAAGRKIFVSRNKRRLKQAEQRERKLLSYIKKKGGRITAFELAAESEYSLDEAQRTLEQLCERGVGQVHLTPQGSSVYVFAGVITDQEKNSAQSPLEL